MHVYVQKGEMMTHKKERHNKVRFHILLLLLIILVSGFSTAIPVAAQTRSVGMISESPYSKEVKIESRYLKVTFQNASIDHLRHTKYTSDHLLMIGPYSYELHMINGNIYIDMFPTGEAGMDLPARGSTPIEYPYPAGNHFRRNKKDLYFYGWVVNHTSFHGAHGYTVHIFQTFDGQGVAVKTRTRKGVKEAIVTPLI